MKIFYCGVQYDEYDIGRGESFEHENFYRTLAALPGVRVRYFPFDDILEKGKAQWNADLLDAARLEKPDLVFCFMYTDEFDKKTLKELKKITTTLAWFADDHWRFYNYSRRWAKYFTWVVTTYSKAPRLYARIGVKNVIRSQWAANPGTYRWAEDRGTAQDVPDVSFVGSWSRPRQRIISALKRAGIKVVVRGGGWPEGRVTEPEMVRLFGISKINLALNPAPGRFNKISLGRLGLRRSLNEIVTDFHYLQNFRSWLHLGTPQIKARMFEIPACCGFTITSMADDLGNYYALGDEIAVYRGTADLIKKIKYYLEHDDEREYIARRGYERTMRDHTYEQRFREIFTKIGLS